MNDIIEIHEEKKDKGFTLVELLIVIVILGILATVTVFAVTGITQNATENTCINEEATVQTAVEAYFVQEDQVYPTTLGQLVPDYLREAPQFDYTITAGEVAAVRDADGNCTTP